MFGIGTGELLLILVIAMLVVGPERMVDYARRGGRLLTKLRAQTDEVTRDFREALQVEMGDGESANPLAALSQLKAEAEGAARDLQGAFTGAPSAGTSTGAAPANPTAAKAVPQATAAQETPAVAPAPQPTASPIPPVQSSPADTVAHEAGAVVELGGAELIDDQEGLELSGPMLIEAADADGDAAQESEGER